MQILVAYSVTPEAVALLGGEGVSYQPHLGAEGPEGLMVAIAGCRPDAVVADLVPDTWVLESWRILMPDAHLILILARAAGARNGLPMQLPPGMSVRRVAAGSAAGDLEALTEADRLHNHLVTTAGSRAVIRTLGNPAPGTVAVVGAGIVGLVTALRLADAGYRVRLLDACPDPRLSADWRHLGCTSGGGNARMFTYTEADNYNDQDGSGEAATLFRRPVSQCGWRICGQESLSAREHEWIGVHERVAPWQARAFNADIFSFNRESGDLWAQMRRRLPDLFDGVEICDGILRLYTDPGHLERSIARHSRIGALRAILHPDQIAAAYPTLGDACRSRLVAGGLEVPGFTVNVHTFVSKLLALLHERGVSISWNCQALGTVRDGQGRVTQLVTDGEAVVADHYVISPGVYGQALLAGTESASLIHGVLGVWMTLPNLDPQLRNSLKISRKGHMAEDANVTVALDGQGREILLWGSGYGYTGLDPDNILEEELEQLYAAVEENVRDFMPRAYASARDNGLLRASRRLCVRPWTPTGLGILEVLPATDGLVVIAGGHNTGGFTQAPSVAEAVLAALEGRCHPMHELYHPCRTAPPAAVPPKLVNVAVAPALSRPMVVESRAT